MRRVFLSVLLIMAGALPLPAQQRQIAEPFKVGTFEIAGRPTVSLVLRDALIVDIAAASAGLGLARPGGAPVPRDMIDLIERYETGVRDQLYEMVNQLVARNQLSGATRAAYVHDLKAVRTLPPITLPEQDPQRGGELLQPRERSRNAGGAGGGSAAPSGAARGSVSLHQAGPRRGRRQR